MNHADFESKPVGSASESREKWFDEALRVARVTLFAQDRQRNYLWISSAVRGKSPEEIVGRREEDFLPSKAASFTIAQKQQILATGEGRRWAHEVELDGELRTLQLRVEPTRDADGTVTGLIGGVIDITDERRSEDMARTTERLLRDVLDNLFAFVTVLDLDGNLLEANKAPLEAAGLTREDVIGKPFWDCYWWSWSPQAQEMLKASIAEARSGATLRYDADIRVADAKLLTLDFQIAPLRDERGNVILLIPSGIDITGRKRAERDLQSALVRTQLALNAGETAVWEWDTITGEFTWDEKMFALWGADSSAPMNEDRFLAAIHQDDMRRGKELLARACDPAGNGQYEADYRVIGEDDGIERWISSRGQALFEHDRCVRMLGTARDITGRKNRENHIHFLMREIAHRSKNLLAVIQAMARQTAMGGGTAEDYEQRFTARLQALARSYDLLVTENWHGASAGELVRMQLSHYSDLIPTRIEIGGPYVMLKPEAAENIGLALHELSTNAAKYGALSNDGGRVAVHWWLGEQDGLRRFYIEWREIGGPPVSAPQREGFGQKVMKRIAAHALEGNVSLDFAPTGVVWRLDIPSTYLFDRAHANAD
ncbi:MAG TPA: PAS domain S-box protein [Beijerinckiaceae bacterium]|nr:PAS domain S-box protein [Beijerinckiaceae bacterium]